VGGNVLAITVVFNLKMLDGNHTLKKGSHVTRCFLLSWTRLMTAECSEALLTLKLRVWWNAVGSAFCCLLIVLPVSHPCDPQVFIRPFATRLS
jgi:hypothetical protein